MRIISDRNFYFIIVIALFTFPGPILYAPGISVSSLERRRSKKKDKTTTNRKSSSPPHGGASGGEYYFCSRKTSNVFPARRFRFNLASSLSLSSELFCSCVLISLSVHPLALFFYPEYRQMFMSESSSDIVALFLFIVFLINARHFPPGALKLFVSMSGCVS